MFLQGRAFRLSRASAALLAAVVATGRKVLVVMAAAVIGCMSTVYLPTSALASDLVLGPDPTPCPAMELIVVRGSGEKASDNHGFGKQWRATSALLHELPGVDISYDQINYPAVGVLVGGAKYPSKYAHSIDRGKRALKSAISTYVNGRCGAATGIYLMGYSQGAHVVGDVYQAGLSTAEKARVQGIALVGDPRFKGSQGHGVDVGTYSQRDNGVWDQAWARFFGKGWKGRPRTWSAASAQIVRSFCVKGDPICNATVGNVEGCLAHKSSCVHSHYGTIKYGGRTYMELMADWIAKRFQLTGHATGTIANIRQVDFSNLSYPGSACLAGSPIQVINGTGYLGNGYELLIGTPHYADLTGDGQAEALVPGTCNNGSETGDGNLRYDYTVFTETPLGLTVLGVLSSYPNWDWALPPIPTKVSDAGGHGIVRVRSSESVYGSKDFTCCASLSATVGWTRHWGAFARDPIRWDETLYLLQHDRWGKARLGMTVAQLRTIYGRHHFTYDKPTQGRSCGTATFGRVHNSNDPNQKFTAGMAVFRNGRLVELDPWSDLTSTDRGIGEWSSPGTVKAAYGSQVHKVLNRALGSYELQVRFAHSTIVLPIGHDQYDDPWVWVTSPPILQSGHEVNPNWCS